MANVTTAMRLFVYKDRFKMGVIAKGEITLSNVNDAYTVSLTKTSCVVNADYDGSNPKLDEAYTTISVKRGDKKQWFKVAVISKTNDSIIITNASMPSGGDESTLFEECVFRFDSVPTDVLEGSATIQISTEDGYVADVVFSYTVVRESTMLDWIQEWEGNKTQIGGNSIITPRLFVGKKITNGENYNSIFNVPQLTGVYIGPAGENGNSCGVYGYKAGGEIFHLDDTGGYIGGWTINTEGIYSAKGALRLLASGTIKAVNSEGDSIWEIKENGDAFFAFENVKFYANGDAEFAGTIKSKDGQIGGWTINDNNLYSTQIGINSSGKYIAIANIASIPMYNGYWDGNHFAWVKAYGGVAMYYSQSSDFGFVAYKSSSKVFSAGSVNMIAGWNFDHNSLWSGNKNNTIGAFTTSGITIGSNGIRGIKWYIDSNGDISFMNGQIKFTANDNGGEIVGWKLNSQRFSTKKVALVSDSSNTGLYLSASSEASFNTTASSSLKDFIVSKGGVYLNVSSNNAVFGAYNSSGGKIFILQSNGTNSIAGWNFDDAVLYTGTKATSGFTASGSITLGPTGLRGYKWRFENNGSGAVAGGNISWDSAGNVTFASSVKIGWSNLGGTIINSEGVFAGKISADNITAGTISTANIRNQSNTWYLNQDGSGALANGNISWDKSGNVTVNGKIVATSGSIGGFEIGSNRIGVAATSSGGGGSLAIYDDFLRVGASNGYVMFGDDVIPGSSGGVFTATGRIVNQKQNTMGSYGFDQANYGLLINVSGGTKNYGIESDAALKAPAFINTKAKLLTFTGNGYTVDFSQYNILLLYYNDSNYSGAEVTLPTESSVARQFGLNSLPSDFAAIVTFRVRPGSKNITLKGIYNHNESSQNYEMASGDSVIVLITKVDGFRYQVLNHSS
jgi:hypothetical protein